MTDRSLDAGEHLRAASDAIMLLLAEIGQLERHKRSMAPRDPRFDDLATSVRRGAEALAQFTAEEESWATDPPPGVTTIERTAVQPGLNAILERWRAVERALDAAEPGSAEAVRLFEEFERLRAEYLAVFRAHEQRANGERPSSGE
ncbi:MAG TPA: hypothetical protein VGK63_04515 [Candidatus Limnocylindrales bacterium]